MPSQVSVIIPALNEAESIGHVVRSMPWNDIAECIVVNNGSTDATAAVAAAAGAKVITSSRGYGAAMYAGLQAALPSSTILVLMDGDGADAVEFMPQLVGPILRDEADFVMGSRLRGKREPGSMLFSQRFAGHLIGLLVKLLHGFRYTDMGPFRAIRREALQRMAMQEMTYGWSLEMQIKAIRMKLRIREIPVNYHCRFGGISKVSGDFKASFVAGTRILGVLSRVRKQAS